jgi:DNA-binding NarL/FixJ family response regulator
MRSGLSPRQVQIITLVALGLSDKEISARLALSPHTVRTYMDRLFQHLGCRSRTRAVALWMSSSAEPPSLTARIQ